MPVIEGFEVLTGTYLCEDWDIFGATAEEAIAEYVSGHSPDSVEKSIAGFEQLLATPMSEDEYDDRWIFGLHSGYDPRDHGYATYREWFAYALEVLRAERRSPRAEPKLSDPSATLSTCPTARHPPIPSSPRSFTSYG